MDMEVERMDGFRDAVAFCLPASLALPNHGGGHDLPSIFGLHKPSCPLVHGSSIAE